MQILILSDTEFTNDPRIIRQAEALMCHGYQTTVLCLNHPQKPEKGSVQGVEYLRFYDSRIHDIKQREYHRAIATEICKQFNFSVIHCHNEALLHIAVLIKRKTGRKIIYDSHELFHAWPLNIGSGGLWLRLKSNVVRQMAVWREKRNSRHIDYCITVCDSLADNLKQYFSLQKRPVVIRNIPAYPGDIVKTELLRKKFSIDNDTKILVFIGAHIYKNSLNLEQVIDEIRAMPNLALVFICADDSGKKAIENHAIQSGANNVFFHPLIEPHEISSYLASADVGLVPTWNKKDLSYWYALDNKLFEYILAGIPVLATRQPEYVKIVEQYSVGICVNPDLNGDYRRGLIDILNNYQYYIEKNKHIRKKLNWENEVETFIDFYKQIRPDVEKCS